MFRGEIPITTTHSSVKRMTAFEIFMLTKAMLVLASAAVNTAHWFLRGGTWLYHPESRFSRLIFYPAFAIVPLICFLSLIRMVSLEMAGVTTCALFLMMMAFCIWRRESGFHATKTVIPLESSQQP